MDEVRHKGIDGINRIDRIPRGARRKAMDKDQERRNRLLITTNALAVELASLPSDEIAERSLVTKLSEMTGATAVWYSEYDPDNRTLVLRHLEMDREGVDKVTHLLGRHPIGIHAPVTDEAYLEMRNSLVGRRETLTEVSFGTIPPSVSAAIQDLLGIDHYIGIAYVVEGNLYGTSILAMTARVPDPPQELLESVARMVAISLRKRHAEKALRESESHYRLLTENLSDVVWTMDLNLNYTYVSPTVTRLRGYTVDEAMSQPLAENLTPASLEAAMSLKAKEDAKEKRGHTDPNRLVTLEAELSRKDGSTIWTENRISYLRDSQGHITGYLGVSRDISERKQAEREEERAKAQLALASRLASIGQLASGVAHEINNPLTVVIGCSQALMENRSIPAEIKGEVERIHDSAQQVATIVKGLLTFARQSQPGKSYLDINAVLSRVVSLRGHEMQMHDIAVETELDPQLPWTMADEGQMQQVFLNIVLNAQQSIMEKQHGGLLRIRSERVGDSIRISFEDNGMGIAKKDLPRLFEPFFSTKDVGEGTGLGLSISYGIVQEHNGRIYARGKPRNGATFVVELPIITDPGQPECSEDLTSVRNLKEEQRVRGRILIVDDEPAICRIVARLLSRDGHSVEIAGDADTALAKLKEIRFSLILLDIRIKGMSGIELYERLAGMDKSLQRKVVFITGDVLAHGTRDFLIKTKSPYICKPFDVNHLRESVNSMLTLGVSQWWNS